MVGEGTVVAAGVADHPNQQQLSLFRMLVCHPVEELHPQEHTHTQMNTRKLFICINSTLQERQVNDGDSQSNQLRHLFIDYGQREFTSTDLTNSTNKVRLCAVRKRS